jgi:beta-1,4-mannosyltransferase
MQTELHSRWGIDTVQVLYDRPEEHFAPTPLPSRRELFERLQQEQRLSLAGYQPDDPNRPALIVSSTSWTADEDFSLLIEAAIQCDALIRNGLATAQCLHFPHLLFILTGKGPFRESYEEQMAHLTLRWVHFHTVWLTAEDYPLLLGSADLGVCLHRSSSGLDLPMKVADMFGSGLPVCAFNYGACLAERVRHGHNGLLFSSSEDLAHQLYTLFTGFPHSTPLLNHLRRQAYESGRIRWQEGWRQEAQSFFARRETEP